MTTTTTQETDMDNENPNNEAAAKAHADGRHGERAYFFPICADCRAPLTEEAEVVQAEETTLGMRTSSILGKESADYLWDDLIGREVRVTSYNGSRWTSALLGLSGRISGRSRAGNPMIELYAPEGVWFEGGYTSFVHLADTRGDTRLVNAPAARKDPCPECSGRGQVLLVDPITRITDDWMSKCDACEPCPTEEADR